MNEYNFKYTETAPPARKGMKIMAEFKLPKGYCAWCHQCGEPPFNKATLVDVEAEPSLEEIGLEGNNQKQSIPGLGFRSLNELTDHTRKEHRVWKG